MRLTISKLSKLSQAQARREDGVAAMLGWHWVPCWKLLWSEGSCEPSPVVLLRDSLGESPLCFLEEDQGEKWSFTGGSEQVKKQRHGDAVVCGVWC